METSKNRILKKHQRSAERFTLNKITSPSDLKRHDRISSGEARAMFRAHEAGLSLLKIGEIFSRDPRAVSKAIERAKKARSSPEQQPFIEVITLTIQPSQRGYPDPQSYVGAEYLNISIPSNDLWIDSITITTSHPESPYKFLIFDRNQPPDFYNEVDIFWAEACSGRRTKYIQPQPQRYHDADECKHLHFGFVHEGHSRDFQLDDKELEGYFRQQVTFTVKLEYRLPS